jgi:indole-3-glycerol phosphate synthase
MNLQTLLDATRQESDARKARDSLKSLKDKIKDLPPARGFARQIAAQPFSLIAEIKVKSPSMGAMNSGDCSDIANVHKVYDRHPVVSAISVLTQHTHFGGSPEDLRRVRRETRKPILRKDFILDEYEVYTSRFLEADAMLLMASVITDKAQFQDLHDLAVGLGMDVLCEVHDEEEIARLPPSVRLCGINSRNFQSAARFGVSKITRLAGRDLTTDLGVFELFSQIPPACVKVAESGLNARNVGEILERYGFNAALVGTSLLRGGEKHTIEELDRFGAAIHGALGKTSLAAEAEGLRS